jgi:hypothetical protein
MNLRNATTKLASTLTFASLLAVAACTAAPAHVPSEAESTSSTTEALGSGPVGGSGGNNFSCGPIGCICYGDDDCNNMFGAGACDGRGPPKCFERGPGPVYCVCYGAGRRVQ